jgi:hypothetical protein
MLMSRAICMLTPIGRISALGYYLCYCYLKARQIALFKTFLSQNFNPTNVQDTKISLKL